MRRVRRADQPETTALLRSTKFYLRPPVPVDQPKHDGFRYTHAAGGPLVFRSRLMQPDAGSNSTLFVYDLKLTAAEYRRHGIRTIRRRRRDRLDSAGLREQEDGDPEIENRKSGKNPLKFHSLLL